MFGPHFRNYVLEVGVCGALVYPTFYVSLRDVHCSLPDDGVSQSCHVAEKCPDVRFLVLSNGHFLQAAVVMHDTGSLKSYPLM